ncbi:hypothetical protein [Fimbriimonas ginsengisoli]|uniref:Uncharacterized protein n=1 Tax=Fimbriimonas ginsengisoli Gsoil 348 TaxID=661478 RepID=A0A068NR28_FIMGI|nr:hypothetical protein [Fimbriimonas ginsengisoli]AIE85205.1 hypothetical protein OP10G_1837 [Fimbriimonas ginsengisoli Gsoil 348]
MSVENRLAWQLLKEQVQTRTFWLYLASVFPTAIATAYLTLGLFYSYLITPNGEILYLATAASGVGFLFAFREFLRHCRLAKHARKIGAPRVPPRYWLGVGLTAALLSLNAGVVPFAVHSLVGTHMSKLEWKRLADDFGKKELPFLP